MEGGTLFNPGFLGASFNWWVGQIPDDSYWRENINPETYKSEKDIPGWGYRYKVRIIGLHDKEEETIKSDQLPWAQVMYPVTAGGGQGGSMQTPNIRQGMFVFGFFLDGSDQQVPVIMGVLGNNTQTKLKSTIGNNESNYAGTSGNANRTGDDGKGTGKSVPEVSDSNLSRNQPAPKLKPIEEAAGKNVAPVASQRQDEKLKEKITLSSPCKEQQSNLTNIKIAVEELSKKLTQLRNALSIYSAAASSKVADIQNQITKLIDETADIIAKCMKGIMDQVKGYTQDLINETLKPFENISIPSFKLSMLEGKISGFETLSCLFNVIGDGLLGLIKDFLNSQFAPQIADIQNNSEQSLLASPPFPFVVDSSIPPSTPISNLPLTQTEGIQSAATAAGVEGVTEAAPGAIGATAAPGAAGAAAGSPQTPFGNVPPIEQTYTPTPACVVEALVGEVLAKNINAITNAADAALNPIILNITNEATAFGGDPRNLPLTPVFLENNPVATLDNTTYDTLGGLGALGEFDDLEDAIGSNAFINDLGTAAAVLGGDQTAGNITDITNQIGGFLSVIPRYAYPASLLFEDGEIAAGFRSLVQASNTLTGLPLNTIDDAVDLLNNGDVVGGLQNMASSLGVPSGLIGSLSSAIQAVQQGNIVSTFAETLGVTSAVPGIAGNIDSAISFISTVLGFFSCDQAPVCPANDHYTLYNGGSTTSDAPSTANIAKQTDEKLKDPDVIGDGFDTPITQAERDAVAQGNIIDEQGNTIGTIG